jgi:PKD repeat protein
MRTNFPIGGGFLALALCAIAANPVMAELSHSPSATTPSIAREGSAFDPDLGAMIQQVGESEMYQSIVDLQNFETRKYPTQGNRQAAAYLFSRLDSIPGLEVRYQGDSYRNVIASLPGEDPGSGRVIVVGAHYDSTSSDPDHAPGAADNGCGVAIVLELARLMSRHQYTDTIEFAFWNAEESGTLGSTDYATHASESSSNIPLYLNIDSSCYDPDDRNVLEVCYNGESESFAEQASQYNSLYDIGLNVIYSEDSGGSDHVAFWNAGYPAIMIASRESSPQTYSPHDTIEYVYPAFAKKNAQLGMVLVAETAGIRTQNTGIPVMLISGGSGVPLDLNGDGLCEDANGNSRKDFADVVLYFNQMSWISTNEPVTAFDYNANGRIDFADVVWLFNHL